MTRDEFVEYWERALDDPDRIWPEDALTEAEWAAGWEARRAIQGLPAEWKEIR